MRYTQADMWRDLMVPAALMAGLGLFWLVVSAIESEMTGRPLWDCFFRFGCGI